MGARFAWVLLVAGCSSAEEAAPAAPDTATTGGDSAAVVDTGAPEDASATDSATETAPEVDTGTAPDTATTPDAPVDTAIADTGPSLASLSDEFSSAATLSLWSNLHPSRVQTLDIGASAAGHLTITPIALAQNAWYSDSYAPLIYKNVTGNFVVETSVRIGRRTDMALAPTGQFNQAGFVVRDAAGTSPGAQRWVMYNIGYQDSAVAREVKTTRNGSPATLSTLYLNNTPAGSTVVRLRVCRIGSTFHFFHRHPSESAFVEEQYTATTRVSGNGASMPTPGTSSGMPLRFLRTDLPATLQVGVMTGTWAAPHDARGEFDYVRFAPASSLADCTT